MTLPPSSTTSTSMLRSRNDEIIVLPDLDVVHGCTMHGSEGATHARALCAGSACFGLYLAGWLRVLTSTSPLMFGLLRKPQLPEKYPPSRFHIPDASEGSRVEGRKPVQPQSKKGQNIIGTTSVVLSAILAAYINRYAWQICASLPDQAATYCPWIAPSSSLAFSSHSLTSVTHTPATSYMLATLQLQSSSPSRMSTVTLFAEAVSTPLLG
ncbi:hypothetical protein BC835DRAFT_1311763 [Cytidiella melzeri]|nr:hypothetical protein BC835DRAFT_1311763 [Cytidiella melzeri]